MIPEREVAIIAISLLKGMSTKALRLIEERGITIEEFFDMESSELYDRLNLQGEHRFDRNFRDEALSEASVLWKRMSRHNVKVLFLLDDNYPFRLSQIPDAPMVLYQLGNADLDAAQTISIVGTRRPTSYGVDFTERMVNDLGDYFPEILVVSGLAYGIDAVAHKAALKKGVPTLAVVAHGLDSIYPASHRDLASSIIKRGGALLSEYPFGEKPYRQRFLERNRIVAGVSDVTVVIESDIKGGAMSTANTAFNYSREVMALPGRLSDQMSSGCNHLIRKEKAHLLTNAADIIEMTGWEPLGMKVEASSRNLFPELEGDAKVIYETLRYSREPIPADRLLALTLIPVARLMSVLGELEFDGIILRHPGNRYSPA